MNFLAGLMRRRGSIGSGEGRHAPLSHSLEPQSTISPVAYSICVL